MIQVPLTEYTQWPHANTDWPIGTSSVSLTNQFAVVAFDNIRTKRSTYEAWFKSGAGLGSIGTGLLGIELEPRDKTRGVIVIECGPSWLQRTVSVPPNCIVLNCSSADSLVTTIDELLLASGELGDCTLNTLIVENISSFYWEKRCKDWPTRSRWYKDANSALLKTLDRFKCNVVVTMWDIQFEKGFQSHPTSRDIASLHTLAYTPPELFSRCSYALSYVNCDVYQYVEGSWQMPTECDQERRTAVTPQ